MTDKQGSRVREKLEELSEETRKDATASQILCEYLEAHGNAGNPDEVDARTFIHRAPSKEIRDRVTANIKTYWACLELAQRLRTKQSGQTP